MSAQLINLSLSRDISSSFHLISKKGLRDRGSLVVKQSEHKERVVLVWFRTCKGFLQDSETLKQIAWGLDVGTRVWPNQYKTVFAFSLSLSHLFYCNQFYLACLKNIIKLIVVSIKLLVEINSPLLNLYLDITIVEE